MDLFCKNLHERLPELIWKLPFWPKGYQDYLPFGLFERRVDFTPEVSVAEIAKHLNTLNELPHDSVKATYLSQKIAKQVQALVEISKRIPPAEKRSRLLPRGITRRVTYLKTVTFFPLPPTMRSVLKPAPVFVIPNRSLPVSSNDENWAQVIIDF